MVVGFSCRNFSCFGIWVVAIWLVAFCSQAQGDDTRYVSYTTDDGTIYLDDNRRPALYTGHFGDCQGDSLINVTRFDASLYRDNLTVMFHLAGSTALKNERVMMFFSVYAYGESRFNLTFNPCVINIPSLCPLNASVPIEANGMIPIGPSDVAGIPSIAFSIPDFEGQAILRLFSNTTQSQIACYSAKLENGNSFSHPTAVGSIIGLFTVVALISSVAVAMYGQAVPETRTHYAHSMSMFVVFSVLQHVFFAGSLSMNWPSVLVAFWSNFGWSAGMIYSRTMQNSINHFIGSNRGNISMVGSAPSNQNTPDVGGGYQLSQLYRRDETPFQPSPLAIRSAEHMLQRRGLPNITTGFQWYGSPVAPGLPLPGNYSGFAGTLAQLEIPASNAFLTGLLWLLIFIVIVAAAMIAMKWSFEALIKIKLVKTTRLDFFRAHWLQFTGAAVLRTCFIAFFMMMYLTMFQLVLGGARGAIALAAVVLTFFLVGMFGVAAFAVWYRLHASHRTPDANKSETVSEGSSSVSWYGKRKTTVEQTNSAPQDVNKKTSWWRTRSLDGEDSVQVHSDAAYTSKFGWLSSRFRSSKWWFFSAWLVYELVRACFYGGAAGHPLVQVFGLLAWEIIAFVAIIVMRPFESNRLNLLMVYLLGFSKVSTVALSCAFDPRFKLSRILTTVIGVIIIVIQGITTFCMLAGILIGAFSSYMSITRNREAFHPQAWTDVRTRYFEHIAYKATDKSRPPPPPPPPEPEKPEGPYFAVSSVRREPKIEDDPDNEILEETYEIDEILEVDEDENATERLDNDDNFTSPDHRPISRVDSVRSRTSASNLPYGAKMVRRSWSVRDLSNQSTDNIPSLPHSRMSIESGRDIPTHRRVASMKELSHVATAGASSESSDWQARRHRRTRSSSNPHGRLRKSTLTNETNEMHRIPSREEPNN